MKTKIRILDVWIDGAGPPNPKPPIICISAKILDEEICKRHPKNGQILLSFSSFDFSFKPGSNIEDEMINLYNAWVFLKDNRPEIFFEFPDDSNTNIVKELEGNLTQERIKWNEEFSRLDKFDK